MRKSGLAQSSVFGEEAVGEDEKEAEVDEAYVGRTGRRRRRRMRRSPACCQHVMLRVPGDDPRALLGISRPFLEKWPP